MHTTLGHRIDLATTDQASGLHLPRLQQARQCRLDPILAPTLG
ncbi:hypothetical protein [Halomonas sp. QHL1]|nr:hypothetical protein [Halomonas sp. QHL1]